MSDSIPENFTQCAFNFDELNSQPVEQPTYSLIEPQLSTRKQCTKCKKWYDSPFTQFFYTDKWKRDGLKTRCKTCESNHEKAYKSDPKVQEHYKARQKAYRERPEVKERTQTYNEEYNNRPEIQAYNKARQKAYIQRPDIKEHRKIHRKAYQRRPEIQQKLQAYGNDYRRRPDIQERERVRRTIYRSNPEIQEKERAYRKIYYSRTEVKEKYRFQSIHRRAIKKAVKGTYSPQQIKEQLKRQKHKCYYCQKRFQKSKGRDIYHIEHTFPLSRVVGTDIPANSIDYIVLACPACNLSKGSKFPWEFIEGGKLL